MTQDAPAAEAPSPPRPYEAIMLDVGDGHWIYVEEVGNPHGVPALFLHGGPGSGSQHAHRKLFDQDKHRAVLFDQRGAGRSHPYLATHANTTQHLIRDIEAIREHLGIDKWLVVGGSWGSTLALAYAQAHPDRVTGIVIRAVFLGRDEDVLWAFEDGPRQLRPDLHRAFIDWLPEAERANPIASYVDRLTNPDIEIHKPAALMWAGYEHILSELIPSRTNLPDKPEDMSLRLPPTAIMEAHYIKSSFFLAPNEILENADKLNGIPGVIVQGRYDILCPPRGAYDLAASWTTARLDFIDGAGHSITETGVFAACQAAVAELTPNP